MLKKLANFSVHYPKLIIAVFIVITLFFAMQLPGVKIDTAIKSQIPEDMPSRINMNRIEEIFGGTEIIIMAMETDNILNTDTLHRLKKIADRMEDIEEIEKVWISTAIMP